jgi:hypothetical protein
LAWTKSRACRLPACRELEQNLLTEDQLERKYYAGEREYVVRTESSR